MVLGPDFNGATRIPRQAVSPAASLSSLPFRMRIPVPDRMARQPSENIIRNLTAESIMRFSNPPPEKVAA